MSHPVAAPTYHRPWLFAAFSLKPYGNQLLSPGANLWIGFVRLIVGALALVEGVSWAYVGSLAGGNLTELSWLFGLALGSIIFVFVWAVDVSLMSLDLDSHYRKHQGAAKKSLPVAGEGEDSHSFFEVSGASTVRESFSTWQGWIDWLRWPIFPVGVRGLLVVASVVVTAPFIEPPRVWRRLFGYSQTGAA